MAFLAEDGTGLAGANSYVSVADADSYHVDRNNTGWTSKTVVEKQYALIDASDFVNLVYSFTGSKASTTQGLEWPRTLAYNCDGSLVAGVPTELERAVYEYALRATVRAHCLKIKIVKTPTSSAKKKALGEMPWPKKRNGSGAKVVLLDQKSIPAADRQLSSVCWIKSGGAGGRSRRTCR